MDYTPKLQFQIGKMDDNPFWDFGVHVHYFQPAIRTELFTNVPKIPPGGDDSC